MTVETLKTSRVAVIDDESAEAMPLIQALGRLGIGCVHIPGDRVEHLPEKPLTGIRVVFLDMQLGTTGTPRQIAGQAANVFSRVISPDSTPTLLVLWTKHRDYLDEFQLAIARIDPRYRYGLFITAIDKPPLATAINIDEVLKHIRNVVDGYFPLSALWAWEQMSHDATTNTSSAISSIVAQRVGDGHPDDNDVTRTTNWLEALRHIYRGLVQAAAGKSAAPETAYADFLLAMCEIHQDRLNSQVIAGDSVDLAGIFVQNWPGLSEAEQVTLNTMFLTVQLRDGDSVVRPGNVYGRDAIASDGCPFRLCGIEPGFFAAELLRYTKDPDYEKADKEVSKLAGRNDLFGQAHAKLRRAKRRKELLVQCIPVLIEVTPTCDYAQRNCIVARFVGGLLVPDSLKKLIVDKGSSRKIEQINLPGRVGTWSMVISARLPFSIPDAQNSVKVNPLFRLRASLLLDVQSWILSQGARPGYLKAEPK